MTQPVESLILDRLFGSDRRGSYHGRFKHRTDGSFIELASRYIVFDAFDSDPDTPVRLKVCDIATLPEGARHLAQSLWQAESRTLIDLTHRGENAEEGSGLARFVASGWDEHSETLFGAWESTNSFTVADWLANPTQAPAHLDDPVTKLDLAATLLRALNDLHDRGLIHRELTPKAVGICNGDPVRVVLTHFGMSVFLSGIASRSGAERLQAGPALGYVAPERLALLFAAGEIVEPADDFSQDLFSLGLVLIELFTRPFRKESFATFLDPASGYQPYEHLNWVMSEVLERVVNIRIPEDRDAELALQEFLMRMTDFSPDRRYASAGQALRASHRVQSKLRDGTFRAMHDKRFKVVVVPSLCAGSLDAVRPDARRRTDLNHAEQDRLVLEELAEDIGGGSVRIALHRYDSERYALDTYGKPRWYLRGQHNLYRLELFRSRREGGLERPWLAYLFQVVRGGASLRDLGPVPFAIDVLSLNDPDAIAYASMPETPSDLGRWDDLVAHLRHREAATEKDRSGAELDIVATLREALAIYEAWPDANTYAVDLIGAADHETQSESAIVTLRYAPERDVAFADARPYLDAFSETSEGRLGFDAWLRQCAVDLPRAVELIGADGQGASNRGVLGELQSIDVDESSLRVALSDAGAVMPRRIFIRAAVDGVETLRRQRRALRQLERSPHRIEALRNPALVHRSVAVPDLPKQIALDLDPNKETLIRAALSAYPAFYVQGPPGTGKTTLATDFIGRVLVGNSTARVLVSAQANEALDNLMGEVLDHLPATDRISALRVRSGNHEPERTDILKLQSDASLSAFCSETLALSEEYVRQLEEVDPRKAQLARAPLESWWKLLAKQHRDIEQVLYQTSNLVFATCLGAGLLQRHDLADFDWVILEEAARAHATEMLIPLLQGQRWLVIGDHLQLEPFNADEHREVFRARANTRAALLPNKLDGRQLRAAQRRSANAERFLALFGYLFENAAPSQRGTLTMSYRLNPAICALIDRLFYRHGDGDTPVLEPNRRAAERSHPYRARWTDPDWLAGKSVVWLDTSYHPQRHEQPRADGETSRENLLEVAVIDALVGRLREQDTELDVMLLSTYLRQREHLVDIAMRLPNTRGMTVAASQGKEADVVILSLVRSNSLTDAGQALGRVRRDSELNVALSRARRLLVIVGDLGHFERFGQASGRFQELIRLLQAWPGPEGAENVCIHQPHDLLPEPSLLCVDGHRCQ